MFPHMLLKTNPAKNTRGIWPSKQHVIFCPGFWSANLAWMFFFPNFLGPRLGMLRDDKGATRSHEAGLPSLYPTLPFLRERYCSWAANTLKADSNTCDNHGKMIFAVSPAIFKFIGNCRCCNSSLLRSSGHKSQVPRSTLLTKRMPSTALWANFFLLGRFAESWANQEVLAPAISRLGIVMPMVGANISPTSTRTPKTKSLAKETWSLERVELAWKRDGMNI